MAGIRGQGAKGIPGLGVGKEVMRMSTRKEREKGIKRKLAELRNVKRRRDEVEKSIRDLTEVYGDLTKRMDEIKREIRLLGGKVPAGTEYNEAVMLWHLRDGRKLSDLRP